MKQNLFLICLALFAFASQSVNAEIHSGVDGNINWNLDTETGVLTLSGVGDMISNWKTTRDGRTVTTAPWGVYDALIKEVEISTGVTNIGICAFYGCSSLTSVTIPDGVTSIEYAAFKGCSSLTSVTIPSSVTSIEDSAFGGCSSLTSVTIPEGVTSIEVQTFYGCSSLTNVTIPEGVTSIGQGAFLGCNSLTSVTIPDGVTSIGDRAFYGCSGLTSIEIPDGVTNIDECTFCACSGLTSIEIPDGVTSIGNSAFCECTSLTSIGIPESVTSIGHGAFFDCIALTSIEIPDGVTSLQHQVFSGCRSLTSIEIPEGVTNIHSNAFMGCRGLTSIEIPDGVSSIEDDVFANCSSLISIEIPEKVTNIGRAAFSGCSSLASIEIPEGVTNINSQAFEGCRSLTTIEIPDGVTSIGDGAFYGCRDLTLVEIPSGVISIGNNAFGMCTSLLSVICKGVIAPELSLFDYGFGYPFFNVDSATLYVPEGADNVSYSSWLQPGWTVKELKGNLTLTDGVGYMELDQTWSDAMTDVVNYTRTFNNTSWQPWYVPFDMTLTSELMEDFAFAKIEGVVIEDQNTADESDDATFISIVRLPEGSVIKGNVPYFVQAKSTGEKTISVENTTVKAAESFSFSVNSASNVFTFTGIYEPRTSTAEDCNAWYYFSGGQFCQPGKAGITLKAMRFYMTIAERADNPYATASAGGSKVIGIREVGDGATDIDTTPAYLVAPVDDAVYDLMGRRVSNPQHGLYIVNGQKRFIP